METIRISPVRMKIILNEEDRRRFAVTDDAFDGDVRGLLRRILRDTEEESLLDTAAGQLHLQVYDGRDGGCEIFLTCLAHSEAAENTKLPCCLALWDTEALFMLCRRLKAVGYTGEHRLLRLGERWYLTFNEGETPLAASDFGETLPEDAASYISEYASPLIENIIAILG
jgi:hypothetical protein